MGKNDEVKHLNNFVETGKNLKFIKCLTGDYHPGYYQQTIHFTEKLYICCSKKHPILSQVKLNYIVDESTFESTPYLSAVFENTGASEVEKAALKHMAAAVRAV